jgi:branched-chain amino acid transport system permease protein
MKFDLLLPLAVIGFLLGRVYDLIGLGLSLILGVRKIIDFAHGQMIVRGRFVAFSILN